MFNKIFGNGKKKENEVEMMNKPEETVSTEKQEVVDELEVGKIIEEKNSFFDFLKTNGVYNKFEYIRKYANDNSLLVVELENYFNYCKNIKNKNRMFIFSYHSFSNEGNFVEKYCDLIVKLITVKLFFEGEKVNDFSVYSANVKNIISKRTLRADEELNKSFLIIDDVDILTNCSRDEIENLDAYLDLIPPQNVVIFKSMDERLLNNVFSRLCISPDFSFQFEKEATFEEYKKHVIGYYANSKTLQENWEKYLQTFIERSRQPRDFKLFDLITERLDREYEISGKQDNVIECKFFGVKVFGIDASMNELKGIAKLNKLIGMEEVKEKVNQLIAYLDFNEKLRQKTGKAYPVNLHMCFAGSPGTGKTTIARIIAEILFELGYIEKNNLVEVDKKDLVSQWVGHTSIKTNEIIQKAMGGVLFVDEAYSVADDNFGKDAIATLIKAMEDHKTKLVVIFAGYEKEMDEFIKSNPGIKSRIGHRINFDDYSVEELIMIYNNKLSEYGISSNDEVINSLKQIIEHGKKERDFGNGRFVDNLIQDILFKHATNVQGKYEDEDVLVIRKEDIPDKFITFDDKTRVCECL